LLSIVPAIVFEIRINYTEDKISIDYINRAAFELLGFDRAAYEAVTFRIDDLLHWVAPGNPTDRARAQLSAGGRFRDQFRLQLSGIGTRWLDIMADCESQPDGWAVWRGVATDVTQLKLAEEAIRQVQERFELAAQAGGIGVWDLDLETGKCVWDDRMHALYGIPPNSFDGGMDRWRSMLKLENLGETARGWDDILETDIVLDTEFEIDRRGEAPRYVRALARMIRGADGEPKRIVGINLDITERWRLQRELEYSASHDALTGLPNRLSFEKELEAACVETRDGRHEHVLCFMDLDRFKVVNDSAGHAAGDAFLRLVGNLIQAGRRDCDFTARLGGDEFALLLRDCSLARAELTARELIDAIRNIRLPWDGKVYDIGASIGVTAITHRSSGSADLMSQADVACYAAKAAGRNQVMVYGGRNGLAERHHREIMVASGIRRAIESNRLALFAQDILTLTDPAPTVRGIEILLRMRDGSGRILRPGSFIPAAERYDLMGNLDRWVIEKTLAEHGPKLAEAGNLGISINLSANSLNDPLFWPFLSQMLQMSEMPPERVNFEITETALINNLDATRSFVASVRSAGYGLILDDFGTGLSSFNYLKQFPVDGLKIDGSFISGMKKSPVDRAIVESINEIAYKLNIRTIAEFVEDAETLEIVREIGIDQAQGYVIGRPIPLDAAIQEHKAARVIPF
jgi:diguanylate cyclase (GGDEF)-like protein